MKNQIIALMMSVILLVSNSAFAMMEEKENVAKTSARSTSVEKNPKLLLEKHEKEGNTTFYPKAKKKVPAPNSIYYISNNIGYGIDTTRNADGTYYHP